LELSHGSTKSKTALPAKPPLAPRENYFASFSASARSFSHKANFKPTIDYVVTEIPHFAFEVFAHDHHPRSPRR